MSVDQSTDDLILNAIHSAEELDGLVVVDAVIIYAAVGQETDYTHYGAVYMGGTMPQYRVIGLLEVVRDEMLGDND